MCPVSKEKDMSCNSAIMSDINLWYQRLGHVNHKDLERLSKLELVRGLPKLQKASNSVCDSCQVGKQIGARHKKIDSLTTKRPVEPLHMDLMGPTKFESIGGKKYIFFLTVDDFSRLTWVRFLHDKSETFTVYSDLWYLLIADNGQNSEGFLVYTQIMELSFKIQTSLLFVLGMALNMSSLHQKHHNKMEWFNGKFMWFKRRHGLCCIAKTYPNDFGLNP